MRTRKIPGINISKNRGCSLTATYALWFIDLTIRIFGNKQDIYKMSIAENIFSYLTVCHTSRLPGGVYTTQLYLTITEDDFTNLLNCYNFFSRKKFIAVYVIGLKVIYNRSNKFGCNNPFSLLIRFIILSLSLLSHRLKTKSADQNLSFYPVRSYQGSIQFQGYSHFLQYIRV